MIFVSGMMFVCSKDIMKICQSKEMEVLAQLPFSEDVSRSLLKGVPIVEFSNNHIAREIIELWKKI